jgi:hypothetical protein
MLSVRFRIPPDPPIRLVVPPYATVATCRRQLSERLAVPAASVRLFHRGEELPERTVIALLQLAPADAIDVALRPAALGGLAERDVVAAIEAAARLRAANGGLGDYDAGEEVEEEEGAFEDGADLTAEDQEAIARLQNLFSLPWETLVDAYIAAGRSEIYAAQVLIEQ